MIDVAVAYNRYKFIGEEFLTWLWFVIENDQKLIKNFDQDFVGLEIGNRIVFENRRKEADERVTIKGDSASLEEGILALKKGALVTELNLVYTCGDLRWQFTIKGESLNFSSLVTPKTALPESSEDLEGIVLEKVFLYEKALELVNSLFAYFSKIRVSTTWQKSVVSNIKNWIQSESLKV
jgi:hypothetical protein